jgi:hypothetical protein
VASVSYFLSFLLFLPIRKFLEKKAIQII